MGIFAQAKADGWVIPAFGTENITTSEAILTAALDRAKQLNRADLPIMLAATNQYAERSQTAFYTHTRNWRVGLELFLADLDVLTSSYSPFSELQVLIHLDHIQHDIDEELWQGDLSRFSSIMFDASSLPIDENIKATRRFVEQRSSQIVIEGACEYIGGRESHITSVAEAKRFLRETGADWLVANLGTEHRAGLSELRYASARAREISDEVGSCLVLHGTSSVAPDQLGNLAGDGIIKVNLWTALERNPSVALLREMVVHAAKVAGPKEARDMQKEGLLGAAISVEEPPAISHFTTAYRQQVIFKQMRKMISEYLAIWYPANAME